MIHNRCQLPVKYRSDYEDFYCEHCETEIKKTEIIKQESFELIESFFRRMEEEDRTRDPM